MVFWLILFSSLTLASLEVIRPDYEAQKIMLKLVRAKLGSFDTLEFINSNSRQVDVVCAENQAYDFNKKAFLRYRNFYDRFTDAFEIESNLECEKLKEFVYLTEGAVDDDKSFYIELNVRKKIVSKIVYPKLDPYSQTGKLKDLLLKPKVRLIFEKENSSKNEALY